ncbi:ABC transporter ATP-binding protein [Vagococcus vulneris]|uniref:ABC transporter ATP-binding protein n=1 Tax=Vagococcus vulneris TaxID=1977869 RepID=A0A430A281_9ENTE|nr:ATP-binding cassette domain-containing protein [Vagococcus vulneris]RSU00551.1 ABC transporter ATP-binding protein [Vagococcus vulneris]
MREAILTVKDGSKVTETGMIIMNKLNLTVNKGDFITVLGGNGAGKSTLFNAISGTMPLTSGAIILKTKDVTHLGEEKRADYLSRVFQDPKNGTAPRMTVAENLLLAKQRGKKRTLKTRQLKKYLPLFKDICAQIGNGLENHLNTPAGNLSGGQRQVLSLLMATINKPEILLLDEHTAALDPKTGKQLIKLTNEKVKDDQLTCLMITHQMQDALDYGNRLIVLSKGQVIKDYSKFEKEQLTMDDLLKFF